MVTRVYGHVEGAEVVFTRSIGDVWICSVPKVDDGEYVIDLYAEDEAGNISYTATILFAVNAKHLIFSIKWIRFANDMTTNSFVAEAKVKDFTMKPIRCDVCGGDIYGIR